MIIAKSTTPKKGKKSVEETKERAITPKSKSKDRKRSTTSKDPPKKTPGMIFRLF